MGVKKDLIGKRFGRLTVVYESGRNRHYQILWGCLCDCGSENIVVGENLKSGKTKSCGCYNKDKTIERNLIHGNSYRGKQTPEYIAWYNMKSRCYNVNDNRYENYGRRGIIVCERWKNSFQNFLNDMGARPSALHSLDRKDNDGIYELSNCRWATENIQAKNRSNNRWIEYNGEKMILQDWARKFNSTHANIITMLKKKPFEQVYSYYMGNKRRKRAI